MSKFFKRPPIYEYVEWTYLFRIRGIVFIKEDLQLFFIINIY